MPYYFDRAYLLNGRFSPEIIVSIKAIFYAQTVISLDLLWFVSHSLIYNENYDWNLKLSKLSFEFCLCLFLREEIVFKKDGLTRSLTWMQSCKRLSQCYIGSEWQNQDLDIDLLLQGNILLLARHSLSSVITISEYFPGNKFLKYIIENYSNCFLHVHLNVWGDFEFLYAHT